MDYRILYCFPFFLSSALIFTAGLFTLRRVNARGGWYLVCCCMASTAWAVSEGMLYLGLNFETNILITKVQYFAIVAVPPFTLLFSLSAFGFENRINSLTNFFLLLAASAIIFLVWTNPLHKLFFTDYYLIHSGPFPMLGLKHGPLWWAVLLYHYCLIAVLSIILFYRVISSSGCQRSQAAVILAAILLVWLINAVYASGHSPVSNMDISPIGFVFVAGAMAWGFFRYGLLDILPVAKEEIFRRLDDAILVVDEKARILAINPAAEAMLEAKASRITGQKASEAFGNFPQLQQVFRDPESSEISLRLKGREHFFDLRTSFIGDGHGNQVGKVIALRDITDRRRAEDSLRESEEKYRTIFHSGGQGFYLMNDVFLECNEQACRIWACTREDIIGHSPLEFSPARQPDGRESKAAARVYIAAARSGDSQRFYWQHQRKDGVLIDCEITLDALIIGGQPLLLASLTDITNRKRTEDALRESEERFRTLFERAPDPFCICKLDGTLVDGNKALEKLTGYKRADLIGTNFGEIGLFSDNDFPKLLGILARSREGEPTGLEEFKLYRKNGELVHAEITTHPVSIQGEKLVLGIARDITDRKRAESKSKRLESQLRQAQKMEAIGTFAGGIAHDFNNILGIILGYTDLAIAKINRDDPLLDDLQEVSRAGMRARDLVQQILTFSRQAEHTKQPVQYHMIVKETLRFLRSSLPAGIEIRHKITSDARVLADPTQLHQVLMNLCANAKHAIGDKGGVLEVSLTEVQLDRDFTAGNQGSATDPYLKLTVADSGKGMSADVLEKIFVPFFTTKGKEEGTGLGLAVVHGIVQSCGGFVTVDSAPGKGTTFSVFLPVIEALDRVQPEFKSALPAGSERVLFVDDEKLLTEIGKQMLESYGYRVTCRTSSVEALALFRAKPDQFDLVITDLAMPNLSGLELAAEMIGLRPEIPVILCTGFSERITLARAEAAGIKSFMLKPVSLEDLIRTSRKVLDARN